MGTRAEIIKMAPLYYSLKEQGANPVVWHVGQHEELAWPFYEFFKINPEVHLTLSRHKQSLGHLSALIMEKLDNTLKSEDIACMVVQGDTSSAFIAALSAYYYKIPIAHVEAGLRTFKEYDPFPEEKNRELISRLARWHFAPSDQAKMNLVNEGVNEENVHVVGNTIVDATIYGVQHLEMNSLPLEKEKDFPVFVYKQLRKTHRLIVVTAHRRENWERGIESIARATRKIVEKHKHVFVVWPVHPNPIIQGVVTEIMESMEEGDKNRVLLTKPLDYPVMLHLLRDSWLIMTDSGGIQEEAITLGVPVLVLRESTERPEVISAGGGKIVGVNTEYIVGSVDNLYVNEPVYQSMRKCNNPFGDGKSSQYISRILMRELPHNNT